MRTPFRPNSQRQRGLLPCFKDVCSSTFLLTENTLIALSLLSDIFSKPLAPELRGITDWHSHILPGVDDGIRSIDHSLEVLRLYENAGIEKVWLTPHIMEDIPNTTAALRQRFDELCRAYDGPVTLALAAENMLDTLFCRRLDEGDLLTFDNNIILVETSYFNPPAGLEDLLERILTSGYTPLIAHPERYFYVTDLSRYRRWKQMGALLQLNLLSLDGYYGPEVKAKAEDLLSRGMYDRAGSDLHARRHIETLMSARIKKKYIALIHNLFQQA